MSKRQKHMKKFPRLQKPEPINMILGSLTLILLFVWGGLYWNESSHQSLLVNAESATRNEQLDKNELELYEMIPEKVSASKEETVTSTDKPLDDISELESKKNIKSDHPQGSLEVVALPPDVKVNKPNKPNESEEESRPIRPIQTTKPSSTPKPSSETDEKPAVEATPEPELPVVTETETPINVSANYEQEIVQIQAKCTQDMNEVVAGAETSMEQIDLENPYAFQELNQKWIEGLASVEANCNTKFQGVIEKAEKDEVDSETLETWRQTYSDIMLQLQGELESKLLQLMGG